MALSQNDLASQLKQLKRTPAPKAPVAATPTSPVGGMGTIDLSAIKLRKTGKRESLIEGDTEHGKENSSNELNNIFAARKKMFEHVSDHSQKPATMPRVAPKPRRISEGETTKSRSGSVPDSTTDSNENLVTRGGETPTLRPLPTLQSLGLKPPPKPPKPLILTMKVEKNYKNHKVMIAPKVKTAIIEEVQNGTFDQDAPRIPSRPPPIPAPEEPELIEEDTYDDVDQLAEIVKSQLEQQDRPYIPSKPPPPQPELIEEDTYDDVDQLAEQVKAQLGQQQAGQDLNIENADGQFGEEFYQPVEGGFSFERTEVETVDMDDEEQPQELPNQPPRESKEEFKARKERERKEKELQKKKEKEDTRRKKEEERREKEVKKKKDDERKRSERMDRDLKKTHKLKGNEPAVESGTTKEEVAGTGKDLSCARGSSLEVITKDNCPTGKWLVRDQQGHYGYVSSELLLLQGNHTEDLSVDDNLDEDLYECVDTIRSQPPPVPSSQPVANDTSEELYDDTVVEEDFYDDIPGAN